MREGHAGVTGIPWGARPWKPGRHAVRKPKRGHLRVFSLGALLRPSWATRILQAIPDSPFQTPRRCHEERKEGRHPRGALPGRRPTILMKDSCGSEPRDSGCALYHRQRDCLMPRYLSVPSITHTPGLLFRVTRSVPSRVHPQTSWSTFARRSRITRVGGVL